jgi:C1A family cysteine protease
MFLLCSILAASALATVPAHVEKAFNEWATRHGRIYKSQTERLMRLSVFHQNSIKIAKLNAAETRPDGARFGTNKYADWSETELKSLRGFKANGFNRTSTGTVTAKAPTSTVATCDWRTHSGVLAPIQDQEQCGSCWAFSATAALESAAAIHSGTPVKKLSEQFLVDCDQHCGTFRFESGCDAGCNGGLMPNAWLYDIQVGGQPSETAYPYQGTGGTCHTGNRAITVPTGWEFAPENEDQLATYVCANGPTSIAVDASNWSFYTGGIMSSSSICPVNTGPDDLDHGVVIVGSGTSGGQPYWIIRNSWNADWGEDGYCRIARGVDFCGVALFACRPTM